MVNKWMVFGCANAFLAVALGAFGAHALQEIISGKMLDVYDTANQYQMIHAIALIITALLTDRYGADRKLVWAGRLFTAGIILFSGSLYVLSLTGIGYLGAITPLGGICFLAGWLLMGAAAFRRS